ncbi:MAG: formamidopyrimidine-DNA glycosylase, partial [Actinomycetota bacterium]|nr:formamidopyrimidine-DNA glycosylase [Actinomycetota bacterium]
LYWLARISPAVRVDQLRPNQVARLHRALRRSLTAAIAQGGVHTGQVILARVKGGVCPRCGAPMEQGVVGGRTTWWCSREQA